MKEILLLKEGEIALKGQNRSSFEDLLIKNAKRRLRALGPFSYFKAQSTIYIEPESPSADLVLHDRLLSTQEPNNDAYILAGRDAYVHTAHALSCGRFPR